MVIVQLGFQCSSGYCQIPFPIVKFCSLALELQGQSAISVDETLKVVACR